MNTVIQYKSSIKNLIIDAALLGILYMMPSISHILPIPIYLADPMRIFLLAGLLITRSLKNGIFLAVSIPIFSSLFIGHPALIKAILIACELSVNTWLLIFLLKKTRVNVVVGLLASILLSKVLYYLLKYLFIEMNILKGELITTNLFIQFAVTLGITFVFSMLWMKITPLKMRNFEE